MADIAQAIIAALRQEQEEIKKRAEAAAKRASKRYVDYDIQRRKDIMEKVAEGFYKGYSPKYYARRGSLYNLMRVTRLGDDEWEIDFDPSKMTYRNGSGGENGLYNTVFRNGYHGGAPSGPGHPKNGVPMWRYPYPTYVNWGKAATQSASPLSEFLKLDDEETEEDASNVFRRLWDEEWAAANGR